MSDERNDPAATGTLPEPVSEPVTGPATGPATGPVTGPAPTTDPGTPGAGDSGEGGGRAGKRPRRRRGVGFWVGIMLVLGGLGMLGYVAWQFYGTNIISKQQQRQIVDDITQEWSVAPGTSVDGREGRTGRRVPIGDAMALIRIPAFGDDYVIPVLEGIGDAELTRGYGHFPDSALPGRKGNFALAAHRITHGEPLRDMPKLRPGDEILVETRDAHYTYVLDTDPNQLIVTFNDVWVVDPLPTNPDGGVQPPSQEPGQRLITLTTCSELFHTDNRMIAFGHLVETEKKTGAQAAEEQAPED